MLQCSLSLRGDVTLHSPIRSDLEEVSPTSSAPRFCNEQNPHLSLLIEYPHTPQIVVMGSILSKFFEERLSQYAGRIRSVLYLSHLNDESEKVTKEVSNLKTGQMVLAARYPLKITHY